MYALLLVAWKLLKYWLHVGLTEPRQRRHQIKSAVTVRPDPRPYDWAKET